MKIEDMYIDQRVYYKAKGGHFTHHGRVIDLFTRHAQCAFFEDTPGMMPTKSLVRIKFLTDATPPLQQLARLAD